MRVVVVARPRLGLLGMVGAAVLFSWPPVLAVLAVAAGASGWGLVAIAKLVGAVAALGLAGVPWFAGGWGLPPGAGAGLRCVVREHPVLFLCATVCHASDWGFYILALSLLPPAAVIFVFEGWVVLSLLAFGLVPAFAVLHRPDLRSPWVWLAQLGALAGLGCVLAATAGAVESRGLGVWLLGAVAALLASVSVMCQTQCTRALVHHFVAATALPVRLGPVLRAECLLFGVTRGVGSLLLVLPAWWVGGLGGVAWPFGLGVAGLMVVGFVLLRVGFVCSVSHAATALYYLSPVCSVVWLLGLGLADPGRELAWPLFALGAGLLVVGNVVAGWAALRLRARAGSAAVAD